MIDVPFGISNLINCKRLWVSCNFFILLAVSEACHGAESLAQQTARHLTLAQAFDFASINSRVSQSTALDITELELASKVAKLQRLYDPTVTISGAQTTVPGTQATPSLSFQNSTRLPSTFISIDMLHTRSGAADEYSLFVNVPLLRGNSVALSHQSVYLSDLSLQEAFIRRFAEQEDILLAVLNGYIDIMQAEENLSNVRLAKQSATRFFEILLAQVEAGRASRLSTRQSEISLKQSTVSENDALYSLTQRNANFRRILNPDSTESFRIIDFPSSVPDLAGYSADILFSIYSENHTQSMLNALQRKRIELQIRVAEDAIKDALNLRFSLSNSQNSFGRLNDQGVQINFERRLNKQSLELSLLQARNAFDRYLIDLTDQNRSVKLALADGLKTLERARTNLQLLIEQVKLAKELLSSEEIKLNMGRSAPNDLTLAQQRVNETESILLSQRFDYLRNYFSLLHSVGLLSKTVFGAS